MSCIKGNNKPQTLDLIFQADNKGYPKETLIKIRDLIPTVKTWLTNNIGDINQDLIAIRFGVPTLQLSANPDGTMSHAEKTQSQLVYETEFVEDPSTYLMNAFISMDYIKITSRQRNNNGNYINTFKMYGKSSDYVHKVFGNYFKNGVYNATSPAISTKDMVKAKVNKIEFPNYLPYLDSINLDGVKSRIGIMNVQYDGVEGFPTPVGDFGVVPEDIVTLTTLISQNIYLFSSLSNRDVQVDGKNRVLPGDKYVNTVQGFIDALDRVSDTCIDRLSKFADGYNGTDEYEDIKEILEITNLDQAFKDLRYGGNIDDLRLLIRVPASYRNEKELKGYLEKNEIIIEWNKAHPTNLINNNTYNSSHEDWYFNQIFPVEEVEEDRASYSPNNIENDDYKRFDLHDKRRVIEALDNRINGKAANHKELYTINDWYDTSYRLYDIIDEIYPSMSDSTKGCEVVTADENGTIRYYRVYRVNYEWLKNAPPVIQVGLLFAGLDLLTTQKNSCQYDTVIALVLIVILAIYASPIAKEGGTVIYAMFIASTIISIGLTMGVWKGEMAKKMAILAAVTGVIAGGAGVLNATTSTATNAVMLASLNLASSTLQLYNTIETYNIAKDTEKFEKKMKSLEEGADMYETNLRFMYGESYESNIRSISEEDPYKGIKEQYKSNSVYKDEGFMSNGFNRPLSYGF